MDAGRVRAHSLPCVWAQDRIRVLECVEILPPYTEAACRLYVEQDDRAARALDNIQRVVRALPPGGTGRLPAHPSALPVAGSFGTNGRTVVGTKP